MNLECGGERGVFDGVSVLEGENHRAIELSNMTKTLRVTAIVRTTICFDSLTLTFFILHKYSLQLGVFPCTGRSSTPSQKTPSIVP